MQRQHSSQGAVVLFPLLAAGSTVCDNSTQIVSPPPRLVSEAITVLCSLIPFATDQLWKC